MNSNWKKNKAKAIYINNDPSLTDQSQVDSTDVNIIMKKYRVTGLAPGAAKAPVFADFTQLPTTLQELLEESARLPGYRDALPEPFKHMSMDELLSLTPTDIQTILTPPEQPATKTEEHK